MITRTYTRPHRLGKLHAELLAALPSLRPVAGPDGRMVAVMALSGDGQTLVLEAPDNTSEQGIQNVLDAHDPTTPGPHEIAEVTADANERTLRQRAEQALTNLENAHENWATLTPAQKDAALKLTVRVSAALVRLQLRKLDNA